MEAVVVRRATLADVPAITALWAEMSRFHAVRDPYFAVVDDAERLFAAYVTRNIEAPLGVVGVAEVDGGVVGFSSGVVAKYPPVFTIPEHGAISDFAVTATHRRRGIGARLFRFAQEQFRALGMSRVELHVAVNNEVSTRFWTKMGLRPVMETRYLDL